MQELASASSRAGFVLCLGAVVFMMGSEICFQVLTLFRYTCVRNSGGKLVGQELHPVPSVVQLSLLLVWSSPDLWVRIAAHAVM